MPRSRTRRWQRQAGALGLSLLVCAGCGDRTLLLDAVGDGGADGTAAAAAASGASVMLPAGARRGGDWSCLGESSGLAPPQLVPDFVGFALAVSDFSSAGEQSLPLSDLSIQPCALTDPA